MIKFGGSMKLKKRDKIHLIIIFIVAIATGIQVFTDFDIYTININIGDSNDSKNDERKIERLFENYIYFQDDFKKALIIEYDYNSYAFGVFTYYEDDRDVNIDKLSITDFEENGYHYKDDNIKLMVINGQTECIKKLEQIEENHVICKIDNVPYSNYETNIGWISIFITDDKDVDLSKYKNLVKE